MSTLKKNLEKIERLKAELEAEKTRVRNAKKAEHIKQTATIGKLAVTAGLGKIPHDFLREEFSRIASDFNQKSVESSAAQGAIKGAQ